MGFVVDHGARKVGCGVASMQARSRLVALPFAKPSGRGETGERQRRRENKLARLDSNQEIQYQKLLCCQLHHGPVAGDGGSRAVRRRPGKMLLIAARRRHESNHVQSRPAAAAGVDAPVANGEVRGQIPVDWKTDRPRRGPPWMGQATSQPHPVPCWRRTSVDGGRRRSTQIERGRPRGPHPAFRRFLGRFDRLVSRAALSGNGPEPLSAESNFSRPLSDPPARATTSARQRRTSRTTGSSSSLGVGWVTIQASGRSRSGVVIVGTGRPRRPLRIARCRALLALARCRQFHVSTNWTP